MFCTLSVGWLVGWLVGWSFAAKKIESLVLVGSLSRAKSNGCCAKADNLLWIRILSRQFVGGDVISIVCQLVPTNAGSNFMGSYFSLCLASSSLFCLSRLLPKQPEDVRSVMSATNSFRNAKSCFLDHRFLTAYFSM